MCQFGLIDDKFAALEIDLSSFGQFDPAGCSMEQAQTNRFFQRTDSPGNC